MDTKDLMELLELLTSRHIGKYDGHLTIMKFSTNWKVMAGTPDLDHGKGRGQIRDASVGETLEKALFAEIERIIKEDYV